MSSFTGWLVSPFKLGREVSEKEARANLRSPGIPRPKPLNKGAIHLDSTCLEYLDRYFLMRGWGCLGVGFLLSSAWSLAAQAFTDSCKAHRDRLRLCSGRWSSWP